MGMTYHHIGVRHSSNVDGVMSLLRDRGWRKMAGDIWNLQVGRMKSSALTCCFFLSLNLSSIRAVTIANCLLRSPSGVDCSPADMTVCMYTFPTSQHRRQERDGAHVLIEEERQRDPEVQPCETLGSRWCSLP